jgi:ABC-type sugar transport system substrate-binding protein
LCCAVAAGALLAPSAAAWAADPYTFALVPKSTNNPFYDQALAGCKKAEAELKGAIKCLYVGPNEHGGGGEQAQIVGDLITKKVDGIAVSPANAAAIAAALQGAKAANIPIITWDSDLLEKDKGLRATYIGAHNYDIGVNLAKLVMEAKPKGALFGSPNALAHLAMTVDRPCGRPSCHQFPGPPVQRSGAHIAGSARTRARNCGTRVAPTLVFEASSPRPAGGPSRLNAPWRHRSSRGPSAWRDSRQSRDRRSL